MNRFRLQLEKSGKIVTEKDWMIAALLALTKQSEPEPKPPVEPAPPVEQSTALESKPSIADLGEEDKKEKKDEEKKEEVTPEEGKEVSESVPAPPEEAPKPENEEVQAETAPSSKPVEKAKPAFNLIEAIKSLQKPFLVDPLAKQEFDVYIVEQM